MAETAIPFSSFSAGIGIAEKEFDCYHKLTILLRTARRKNTLQKESNK